MQFGKINPCQLQEWIILNDSPQLFGTLQENRNIKTEIPQNPFPNFLAETAVFPCLEDHIPALDISSDLSKSHDLEAFAELLHFYTFLSAHINAAEHGDIVSHINVLRSVRPPS